jgi:hypothetical protein
MLSKLTLSRKIILATNQTKKIQSTLFQNKRFYVTPESTQITENKTYESSQDRKELKRTIAKNPPRFMKLWYLLGVAGVVGATMYYLNGIVKKKRLTL